ncbi:uncharacterized protein LAESUDRAFT_728655 [Laetiporus sulphureus 93-53]|uniref:RTA1-domain-containing protein n=1 Tax=Laetiporus sulphureus 93-53 TaxID=1314785 RepID=A0A165D1D9_9APHY|nr:uncharacterized protein LAESUDRAFT_728655 [Laetiporus sulphureus 93-53]KZT03950.1 hypothetical protein LAESUDRAFT_728655 [Laetiporus sulphureus 93-53]
MSSDINYAHAEGIYSVAGAVILTVVYAPLLAFYLFRSVTRPTYVHFVLALFCLVRVVAFALRAALAGNSAAAHNENVLIAEEIIYQVSFFGVLYSAYTLVLDREALVDIAAVLRYFPSPLMVVYRIMRMRHLIRIALIAAIALGIAGTNDMISAKTQSAYNTAISLRSASVYIFLAVTCLLVLNSMLLAAVTIKTYAKQPPTQEQRGLSKLGATYGIFFLLAIAAMLFTREAFYAATEHHTSEQINEKLWYPLSALTELIAVMLFAVPGLVPSRKELPKEETSELNLLRGAV